MPVRSDITIAAAPMMGGMIWPALDAVASTPPAKAGENPRCLIIGIVMTPVATTLVTAPPDMVPNRPEARMAAWAGPPRNLLVTCTASLISDRPPPVRSSIVPSMMKGNTVKMMIPMIVPRIPSPWLNHKSSEVSARSTRAVSKIHGQCSPV